jgi:S1-C subfamily serine protease
MRSLLLTLGLLCVATPSFAVTCEESFQKKGDFFNGSAFSGKVQVEGLSVEKALSQLRIILARDGIKTLSTDVSSGVLKAENPATPFQRALPIDVFALAEGNLLNVEMIFTLPGGVGASKKTVQKHICSALNQLEPGLATSPSPGSSPQASPVAMIAPSKSAAGSSATSSTSVYKIASQTTVLIDGQTTGSGSGVIISKIAGTYYVLTAKHVVDRPGKYTLIDPNGKKYALDYSQVKKFTNLDLAVVQFKSTDNLAIAQMGDSEKVSQGDSIYVSGWPAVDQAITKHSHLVTEGRIAGVRPANSDGYELMYGNSTGPGMSGGPIFNNTGRVVGIHGRAAGNTVIGKVGINLGIPIHLFWRQAPQAGLNLQKIGLKAENLR